MIGASGMLGHMVSRRLATGHEVTATVRRSAGQAASLERQIAPAVLETGIDVLAHGAVGELMRQHRPKWWSTASA